MISGLGLDLDLGFGFGWRGKEGLSGSVSFSIDVGMEGRGHAELGRWVDGSGLGNEMSTRV